MLVTMYCYCSMFNPSHIWLCDVVDGGVNASASFLGKVALRSGDSVVLVLPWVGGLMVVGGIVDDDCCSASAVLVNRFSQACGGLSVSLLLSRDSYYPLVNEVGEVVGWG